MYYTSDTLVEASRSGTHEMFTGMSIIAFNAASEAYNLTGISYPNGSAFDRWHFDSLNVTQVMANQQQASMGMFAEEQSYGNTLQPANTYGKDNGR